MADNDANPIEEPTAVNLWNILSGEIEKRRNAQAGERELSWEDEAHAEGGVPVLPTPEEPSLPAELDSNEIPYTHANSLTGHANETAELHSGYRHPDLVLADSAIFLAEAISPTREEYTNYELAAMPWPLTPASQDPEIADSLVLATEDVFEADTNTDSDDIADSVAHYTSEQRLFEIEPAVPQSPIESSCDLDTFLTMGHVENCWCRDCEEEPELVNDDWATPLTESDGWMVWSTNEDENISVSPIEPTCAAESADEDGGSFQTWTSGYDWDDLYPSMFTQTPVQELEDQYLAYYNDDTAFDGEVDPDWMWAC